MAQRTEVILDDDLDGGPATQTIPFGLDGQSYELDLNDKNAAALRAALERYVAAARKVGGERAGSRARARTRGSDARGTAPDPKAVRMWAASHKIKVSPRGRIP